MMKPHRKRLFGVVCCCVAMTNCSQGYDPSRFHYVPAFNSVSQASADNNHRVLHDFTDADGASPVGG
jgi:hypothetical protein